MFFSHFQKYRLFLKRMQGHLNGAGLGLFDPTTDHFFGKFPVSVHFLPPVGWPGQGHFFPFFFPPQPGRPIWGGHPQLQQQFYQQKKRGQFGFPPKKKKNGQFEPFFMGGRPGQQPGHRGGGPPFFGEKVDFYAAKGGGKVFPLFSPGGE
uniref:Transcription factor PCL1-like protein n=1 Tax=Sedum alfredii TaxID=439688 RepID=A0A8E4XWD2_9MAGN|nr:transcription factor PCL1-like protein [Sedum alfredii]